jgi:hypothetical protein
MTLIINHIKSLERTLYRKSEINENNQIKEIRHYDPIGDKYLLPISVLTK